MSIVSPELGYNVFRRSSARKGPVQYSPAALGEKEPPPYFVNPHGEVVNHFMRSFTRRGYGESMNTMTHGTDVPLKCDQYGSHAGAYLFYADTPVSTEALKIEDPTTGIRVDQHHTHAEEHYVPPAIDYDNLMQGLRSGPRKIILNQPSSEPAPAEFRPEHFTKGHYKPKGVNFNLGMYGLNPIA